jgi:hypothetical protein
MLPIDITDQMKKDARRADTRIMATFKKKNANYTGLIEPDRFYFGVLGELAFIELLKQNGIKAKYAPTWDGKRDSGDAVVYVDDGYPLKIDVKTASKAFHENLWIPEKQYARYTYDGYIGVRLVDDVAEIHGYCAKTDFTKTVHSGAKVPNFGIALDQLRPMERLFKKLDKGETFIKLP